MSLSPVIHAPHNNYIAYNSGVENIFQGVNPYPPDWDYPAGETECKCWFLYGPVFGILFHPFSEIGLGMHLGIYLWLMISLGVTLYTVFLLIQRLNDITPELKDKWFLFALILCFNELQGALMNLQANVLIGALTVLALLLYEKNKRALPAFLLALGISIKIFPIVAMLLLFTDFDRKFIGYSAVFLTGFFSLPLLFIDGGFYIEILKYWFTFMANTPLLPLFYGLEPMLLRYGLHFGVTPFMVFALIVAMATAVCAFRLLRRSREHASLFLIPLSLGYIILFNRMSEKPTFVLMIFVLVITLWFARHAVRKGAGKEKKIHLAVLAFGWVTISLVFSDFFPGVVKDAATFLQLKFFGALALYIWAWWLSINNLRSSVFRAPSSQ